MLVALAVVEPGDNWVDFDYRCVLYVYFGLRAYPSSKLFFHSHNLHRWSKYDDPVPGWVLPQPWTLPDGVQGVEGDSTGGPRDYGWLRVTYRSEGFGCAPSVPLRKALRSKLLAGMKKVL